MVLGGSLHWIFQRGGRGFLWLIWSGDITKSIEAIRGDFRAVYWGDETFQGCCFFATRAKEYSLVIGYALLIICKSVLLPDVVYLRV